MNIRITVLIENTTRSELKCEHGLSLFIEYSGQKILLDAGSTELFAENARALGIDIGTADYAVLSHGHYDHSGGFGAFFIANPSALVYARENALEPYFSGSGSLHEIGVPKNVLAYRERFRLVSGNFSPSEGVLLIPHSTPGLESIGQRAKLYKNQNGAIEPDDFSHEQNLVPDDFSHEQSLVPDDFSHEQSLVLDTPDGLIIFNSCSHGGVANIIREVRAACPGKPVKAYIGGLHMKGRKNGQDTCTFSDAELDQLSETILREGIETIYTGHCTGLPGLEALSKRLGSVMKPLYTGLIIKL